MWLTLIIIAVVSVIIPLLALYIDQVTAAKPLPSNTGIKSSGEKGSVLNEIRPIVKEISSSNSIDQKLPQSVPSEPKPSNVSTPIFDENPERSFFIIYSDNYGRITERVISKVKMESGMRIKAYCHLRKEERTFQISSIQKLIDEKSGVEISDINKFFGIELPVFPPDILKEAEEIAAKITTFSQFTALERKLESVSNKVFDYKTEKGYNNAVRRQEVLELAVQLLSDKIFMWQFIPSLALDTPLIDLERAYKLYTPEEYAQQQIISPRSDDDWLWLDVYNEPEAPDPILKDLIAFRKIVEADISQSEKIKRINKLASKKVELAQIFFGQDNEFSPGDQWFIGYLSDVGLPFASDFYREGFTTLEKCLSIDPAEFIKRKGVGKKTVERLIAFQENARLILQESHNKSLDQ